MITVENEQVHKTINIDVGNRCFSERKYVIINVQQFWKMSSNKLLEHGCWKRSRNDDLWTELAEKWHLFITRWNSRCAWRRSISKCSIILGMLDVKIGKFNNVYSGISEKNMNFFNSLWSCFSKNPLTWKKEIYFIHVKLQKPISIMIDESNFINSDS